MHALAILQTQVVLPLLDSDLGQIMMKRTQAH